MKSHLDTNPSKSISRIQLLPLHEAQKIAAGEVVERPVSVVKELIENALDAGATRIELRFKDAGKKQIRIIDNGCGMSLDDARLCTAQYATSKIRSVEELSQLTTFGFRGEALASIAAVSHLTIITKDASSREGVCISIKDQQTHETLTAASVGTDITVDDLFYNVPARKKFLKKSETEWRQIMTLIHAVCLNHPAVHYKVIHDDAQVIACPPASSRLQRITHLWGAAQAQQMLTFTRQHSTKDIYIEGFISNHQFSKFDRSTIFFFVNGRWIKNQALAKALIKGYMNVLPPGRYPAACIFLTVDPAAVDINIHPRKEEVQFLHSQTIENLIQTAVKETLEEHISMQLQRPIEFAPEKTMPIHMVPHISRSHTVLAPLPTRYTLFDDPFTSLQPDRAIEPLQKPVPSQSQPSPSPAQQLLTSVEEHYAHEQLDLDVPLSFEVVGYYKKTYILVERQDGLFIIDQHAAHERVLYEQFASRFTAVPTVKLLFPTTIHLNGDEMEVLNENPELLAKSGIIIEPFGNNQCIISATPVSLKSQSVDDIIRNVAAWLLQEHAPTREELHTLINKKLHAQMACKAAVKAGDELSPELIQQLLKDLHTTPNRFTCPHGRPTSWLFQHYELEKRFKRKV